MEQLLHYVWKHKIFPLKELKTTTGQQVEVDAKGLEMQQFLVDKEKEYKSLDTPLKKQTFEEKVAQEFKAKETAYVTLKNKREQEVFTKIKEAAKAVMVEIPIFAAIFTIPVMIAWL